MKTMKHKIISVVAGMLLVCLLPVGAQNRPWQSTSAMQQGSTHRFDIRAVDATNVTYKYLLMTSTSPLRAGEESPLLVAEEEAANDTFKRSIRRGFDHGAESGQSSESPIGEILLLFAVALAATTAIRLRRRQPAEGE